MEYYPHQDGQEKQYARRLLFALILVIPVYDQQYGHTNPSFVFATDISSFVDKAFHCVITTSVGCNMQGSPLIEVNNRLSKNAKIFQNLLSFTLVYVTESHSHIVQVSNISDELYLFFSDPCNYSRQSLWSMWTDKLNSIFKEQEKKQHTALALKRRLISHSASITITYNYPIIILNVDISFLFNKVLHHFDAVTFSCQVQGSHLLKKKQVLKHTMQYYPHQDRQEEHYARRLLFTLISAVPVYDQQYGHTNPSVVFATDISSFLDKPFHCVNMTFAGCSMQGSPLIQRETTNQVGKPK